MKTNRRTGRAALLAMLCLLLTIAMAAPSALAVEDEEYYRLPSAKIGNCKEFINLRDGPGTTFDILGQIKKDTPIKLYQWNREAEWCMILYNGGDNLAWISGEFIVQ